MNHVIFNGHAISIQISQFEEMATAGSLQFTEVQYFGAIPLTP